MVAFQDSKVVKFPDLELFPGQQREIDQQKPVKYPSAFDTQGKPAEFSIRGVGMKINATILGVTNCIIRNKSAGPTEVDRTNCCVSLRYRFWNVTGPFSTNETVKAKEINNGAGTAFHTQSMNGNIVLYLGKWIVLSGMDSGKNRRTTWFMKIEKK